MRILVLSLGFILCLGNFLTVCAQDVKGRTEEMENVFKMLRPTERKSLVDGYTVMLSSSLLTGEEKEKIHSVFTELQAMHVTVTPELKNYILSVNSFFQREEKNNLMVWLEGLQKVLAATERKRTLVKNYLETTASAAIGQMLFDGGGHQWLVKGKVDWQSGDPINLTFREVDLVCRTRKDSILIYGTSGRWTLGSEQLKAEGGKVKWNNSEEVNAVLNFYQINLKVSGYTADSVCFHYESKYNKPLWGKLKDNALKYARTETAPFPEFTSYDTDIEIKDMYQDVSFLGGVTYSGMKFSGTGTEEHPASLHIVPNDSIGMILYSKQFLFDSLRIMSGKVAMEIVMNGGDITHSNVNFSYAIPTRVVSIKRISEQSLHLPFKDSYHQILFDMEEIFWPIDSTIMEMRMSSRTGLFKATVESMNFFSDQVYDNIQGMDEVNPLNGLLQCSNQLQATTFTVGEYAEYLKKPADQLRKQMVLLSYNDFVDYNESKDEITLKQRLFDYTLARVGKQDYDNIRFTSQPDKSRANAVLDIRNYNLRIDGVTKFVISESKNISVEPSDQQVVMMKNRDMAFNGKLNAGMFDMYGNHLFFSYDKYTIALPKVDSTSMYMAGRDQNIRGKKVSSLIRDITGEIVIDKSDNKSGKKEDAGFPVLNSTKESYVYFDDPAIQKGQYKRDSFYYKIKPYRIKGINDASRFRYAFNGTLVSNIVAPIEDTLRLLEDNALGIKYKTPSSGLVLYDKGRIYNNITLNRQGFMAQGKITMNKSEFNSDSILMLPDRLSAHTQEITVAAVKDQRPGASGKQIMVDYFPADGSLQATSISTPFEVYEGRIKHSGKLLVYENILDAAGKLELEGAELKSSLFKLQSTRILSENTALNIASVLNKEVQLNTSDVKAEIDLAANVGRFVNNATSNRVVFTSCRYNCSFERFSWYMKEAYLNIGPEDQQQLAQMWTIEDPKLIPLAGRNVFVSTNKLLDSLNFLSPSARYDLKKGDIACQWVNHIDLANGRFYPIDGKVDIHSNGEIQEFVEGRLLCERTDTSKLLTQVSLKVNGRDLFSGKGNYQYISEEKKTSNIHFSEIGTDSLKLIYAKTNLTEETILFLNDGLKFKGNVVLNSRQPHLFFAGCVGLTVSQSHLNHRWLTVKDYLDARHVQVKIKVENRDDKQQRIYNGIYLNTDKTFRPYAAFMSNRLFYNDDLLVAGEGSLEWSGAMQQYIISNPQQDKYYRFRYDPEAALVSSYGKIALDLKIPGMYQKMAGDISYHLEKERLDMSDLLYLLDFALLPKMENVLLKDFADKKLKTIEESPELQEKFYEIYGIQMKKPLLTVPDSLNRLLVLDSLNLKWNDQTRSYMANGQVNVVTVKGKPTEKRMNVKMELLRSRSGNQYFMYIYDDYFWYYFEYSDRSLYTLSSNEEYNEAIRTEKAEKKIIRNAEKETLYTITLCPDSKRERFLKRVKN